MIALDCPVEHVYSETMCSGTPSRLAIMLVLLSMLAATLPMGDRVLCLGTDGHIAIESPHLELVCVALESGPVCERAPAILDTSQSCVDIDLDSSVLMCVRWEQAPKQALLPQMVWLYTIDPPTSAEQHARLELDTVTMSLSPQALSLRSTVLLI